MCKNLVDLEVMFGGTMRAVATMAMAMKAEMSFVSIAMVALPLEIGSVVWMAGLKP